MMTIGSVSGTQMSWPVAQSRQAGPPQPPPQAPSGGSATAGAVSENPGFFQGGMTADTMAGLLQAQGSDGGFKPPALSDIDSDGDGSLTQAEFESYGASVHGDTDTSKADELFSRMDSDGDGTVTSDEKDAFDTTMTAQKPHGPPPGGPPPGDAPSGDLTSSGDSSATSSQNLTDLMQELLTALDAYRSSTTATTSAATGTTSIAA